MPSYRTFFDGYVAAYNRSLGDEVDEDGIRSHFSPHFIAAGPEGVVTGNNGLKFARSLRRTYAAYKKIGTKKMSVRGVRPTPIDETHDLVAVDYRADYVRPKDGKPITIDFTVTYALEVTKDGPKIFAFVAGDEVGLYKQYGLME